MNETQTEPGEIDEITPEKENEELETEADEEVEAEGLEAVAAAVRVPTPRKLEPEERRLNWLVHDFQGLSDNIYEAVMVAAHRARQIGRRQKREIEDFKSSLANVEESLDDENNANRGIDHFQHSKPTVLALKELRERKYRYYYPEHLRK